MNERRLVLALGLLAVALSTSGQACAEALPRASGSPVSTASGSGPAPVATRPALRLPGFLALGTPSSWTMATELALSLPYNDPKLGCAGPCTDAMPSLSLPSSVLASMAVIGIGVGMGLVMASSKAERFRLPPVVRFKLAFSKALATTTLRF